MAAQEDANKALYQKYLEACNAHDFEGMSKFYATPIMINDEPWEHSKVLDQFRPLVAAFPDFRWHVRHLGADGPILYLLFKITATHTGEFQGIAPTGRQVETTEFTIYHVSDGKFVAVWDNLNVASLVKQIQ